MEPGRINDDVAVFDPLPHRWFHTGQLSGLFDGVGGELANILDHDAYPFGEKPVGRIEYDKEGRVFALLMRSGRRSTVAPGLELDAASVEEIREAVTGFVAYFGSYEVDDASQTVTHHVEASLVPSWVGTSLKRRFRFEGARLVLTRAVSGTTDELVWERA